jgi:peptidoglycan/LPS O-acetylase OafA/YrhL
LNKDIVLTKIRLSVFDLLRIIAISLIFLSHLQYFFNFNIFLFGQAAGTWIFHVFFLSLGNIGVILFIFISGAVLELNKKPINTVTDYLKYMYFRLIRIYPAYWMSLISVAIFYLILGLDLGNLFWQFSGFSAFVNQWGGVLNPVGWFIGLLISLYLLFPFLSEAIEKKPELVILLLFLISFALTYLINATCNSAVFGPYSIYIARWFPFCYLFYFGIGIFIAQKGYYPGWHDKTGIITWLGKLSFYVFLFQLPVIYLAMYMKNPVFLLLIAPVSIIVMKIDDKIQILLKKLASSFF